MFSHKSGAVFPPQNRWRPTHTAAELHYAQPLTDPDFFLNEDSCRPLSSKQNGRAIYLPSCAFLWTPQQRLHVQPGPFCCTQNLPQSPLRWANGPADAGHLWTALNVALPLRKIILEQIIHSVLAMLLLALRSYFMTGCSHVLSCINKEMQSGHGALSGLRCVSKSDRTDGFEHG